MAAYQSPALRGGRRELRVAYRRHAYGARATGEAGEGADNDNDTNTKVSDQGASKRLYVASNYRFRGCGCPFVSCVCNPDQCLVPK